MRILLTADWHINNYSRFNSSVDFRLNQFVKLAYDIADMVQREKIDLLVIAGDFIDIPIMAPKIQHVAKKCLDILKKASPKVYYIFGQHDLDTKGTIRPEDSIISLFDDDKFVYANHKVITPEGVRIGFQDWSVSQDTSWIEEKLDVLIGHYTKSNLFGQEIDEDKFDLMIHGDIHNSQVIGKFVSICNPIQKDMSSEASGCVIIYDTVQRKWDRIRIDEPHQKYLRIEYTRNPEEEGWASPILYKIFKPVEVSASGEEFEVPIPEWSEINDLIEKVMVEQGLADIHHEVMAKTQSSVDTDFNFQLKYIKIHNYRSIKDMTLDFTGNDIILLLGENGSGKSSVMSALEHLFYYDTHLNDERTDFLEEGENVQLEYGLYYQGKFFVIKKGEKWGLEIDGVEQGFPSKPQFESRLPDYLPFLEYSDVFFISSTHNSLTGRYTPERKSELLSKFFKFDKVLTFSDTSRVLKQAEDIKYGEIEKQAEEIEHVISYLKEKLDHEEQFEEGLTIEGIQKKIDFLQDLKAKFKVHEAWSRELETIKTKLGVQTSNLEELNKTPNIDLKGLLEKLSEMEASLNNTEVTLAKTKEDFTKYVDVKKRLKTASEDLTKEQARIRTIESSKCPTCGAVMMNDIQQKLLKEAQGHLEVARTTHINLSNEYAKLRKEDPLGNEDTLWYPGQIDKLTKEINSRKAEIDSIKSMKFKEEANQAQRGTLELRIEALKKELADKLAVEPEQVEYPASGDVELRELDLLKSRFEAHLKNQAEYEAKLTELQETRSKLEPILARIELLNKYTGLTCETGAIYVEILGRIAQSFSNETVQYYIEHGTYRRKDYLIFQAKLRVKKTWRHYEALSSGQKNVVDLDFLSKMLATRSGLLAADEMLKHLDTNRSVEAAEVLSRLNVNTLLVATHSISFPTYTKKLLLELDEIGQTKMTEES